MKDMQEKVPIDLNRGERQTFDIIKSDITFKDVGGLHSLKEELRLKIVYPFENKNLFKKYGKKAGGGILLYGPPGCGKTYIAKACAGEIDFNFINVTISDIKEMWHGLTEKNISSLFKFARKNAPSILFIDEIDALCTSRSSSSQDVTGSMTNQFLTELDGVKSCNEDILVVGATNAPWALDHAFLRYGRFDKSIFVPPPDLVGRAEILKLLLKGKPCEKIDLGKLANQTEGFSGADLKNLVETTVDKLLMESIRSKEKVVHKLTDEIVLKSIPSIIPSTLRWFNQVKLYIEYGNDDGFYNPVIDYCKSKPQKEDKYSYLG